MTAVQELTEVLDAYPLASMQAGMLYASSYEASSAAYHDVFTVTLRGAFEQAAFEGALEELVAQHPVLRTSFDMVNLAEPVQLVHAGAVVPLTVHDWAGLDSDEVARRLDAWGEEEEHKPFDWAKPPLLRATVHLLPAGEFALSLNFHHAIIDGWSLHTFVTELLHRYLARLDGNPLPVPAPSDAYRAFVARERKAVASKDSESFWRKVVDDAPLCGLPTLPGYAADGPPGSTTMDLEIDTVVTDRLAALARELKVPLRTVLLAAHLRVVGLLSGESDVLTGRVTHNRPETEDGAELVGLFVNTVPVRVTLDAASWSELITRVYAVEVAAIPHRSYPLFEIQRLAGRSPLFETMFDFRHFRMYEGLPQDGRIATVSHAHREHSDIPFIAAFSLAGERLREPPGVRSAGEGPLHLSLQYDRRRLTEDLIQSVLGRYLTALQLMAGDPDSDPRGAEAFLSGEERALVDSWNDTAAEDGAPTLHDLFFAQAERTPDAVAVIDSAGEHSYDRIRRRANALAVRLRTLGAGPEGVVAIYLDRGADFVVALLGVLRAGAAALPLDRDHPEYRLLQATADAGAAILVTRADLGTSFPFNGVRIALDDAEADAGPAVGRTHPEALAYVLYTSGSTGRPKGVMLAHRAFTNYLASAVRTLNVDANDRVGQRTPVGWDAAIVELFVAFATGATVVVISTEAMTDPATLEELVNRHGVTLLILVPSLLAVHLDAGTFANTPSIRVVASAGEALTQHAVDAFAAQTDARLLNFYGPTEAGIGVSEGVTEPGAAGAVVPIGRPNGNVKLYVLDDADQMVPVGVPGELHVSSVQLARGYLGRAELTAERFVPDHLSGTPGARLYRTGDMARWRADGRLEFLGRRDGQVKIRGVRVELGEVEAALRAHPRIRHAAVVARPGRDGRLNLAAYVVGDTDNDEDLVDSIRAHCRGRLVRAAMPSAVVILDELPLLPGGKVDRSALPIPDLGTRAKWIAPRDPVEARLSSLWAETLGVDAVGVRDDFFDLGGHSLLALQLTMRLRKELGREIPVETVISASTVERLANMLRSPEDLVPSGRIVPLHEGGDGAPLFIMHGLGGQVFRYHMLVRRMDHDRSAYAIPANGFAAGEAPQTSLESMADDYADRIQAVHPHGPYLLAGHCIGGNIALEVARRLRVRGEAVPLVTMFWTRANEPVVRENAGDDVRLMMLALAGGATKIDADKLRDLTPDEQLLAVIGAASQSGELISGAEDLAQARRIFEVYRANALAVLDFQHEPYDGDVLLVVPEDDVFVPGDVFGWDEIVTGTLHVDSVPGNRGTSLDEPLVQHTGAVLQAWVARVDDNA